MTQSELLQLLNQIQKMKCETQTLELKAARVDCPKRLYDTLSSFSNQDDGGIIVFGVDESNAFQECGVYDAQDLQKKIVSQCQQMEPVVRPLMTVCEKNGRAFVSAEIPGIDIAERPCYYLGKGRLTGSYIRSGDSDETMTEYEIYSYEAYRKKYQDDIRIVDRADLSTLNPVLLEHYMKALKSEKPNLAALNDETIRELMSITKNGKPTLSAVLLFGQYPQAFFPQLCITAIVVPGTEIGQISEEGDRFLDNEKIEGTIPQMLDRAVAFVRRNMRTRTIINEETGKREDRTEYPIAAVREAVINALVHRDYSIHTEGMPTQMILFDDRMEIRNPGGLYGRLTVDQLGRVQPDTRNPVLVSALEVLNVTENRYSGIPTMRRVMREYHLQDPVFIDRRGQFTVTLPRRNRAAEGEKEREKTNSDTVEQELIRFLETPRTRGEIAAHLGLKSVSYAIHRYIMPLVEAGTVKLTVPDRPGSHGQRYYSER